MRRVASGPWARPFARTCGLAAAALLTPSLGLAHDLGLASLDVDQSAAGEVRLQLRREGGLPIAATPVPPPGCTQVALGADRWRWDCRNAPPHAFAAAHVHLEGPDAARLSVVFRLLADGDPVFTTLAPGHEGVSLAALALAEPQPFWRALARYGSLGLDHIAAGWDHLLFLLGLVLVARRWTRLLPAVTAFTVGHATSLLLVVGDVVRVASEPVEACIALSLVFVGLEALRPARRIPGPMTLAATCAAFGLIHGLGFAAALVGVGVPRADLVAALVGFNLGVEVAQLLFVGVVLLVVTRLGARRARGLRPWLAYGVGSLGVMVLLITLGGCASDPPNEEWYDVVYTESRPPCAARDRARLPLFGDTHVHTAFSFDAWAADVRLTADDALAFARGAEVLLPPLDGAGLGTTPVRIDRPLDFAAVTDHSEFFGEVQSCITEGAPGYDSSLCISFRERTGLSIFGFGTLLGGAPERPSFCRDADSPCTGFATDVWQRIRAAARAAYDTTDACTFTAFQAYEYSGAPDLSNLHRNVIFRNEQVPARPVSYFEAPTPGELWSAVKRDCLDAGTGCDVLMIPHNSNLSNGRMFEVGEKAPGLDERGTAQLRHDMEPLVEIYQHKGDSECMSGLSAGFGPPDELCAFEKVHVPSFTDCGDSTGASGLAGFGCVSGMDFVRSALAEGLRQEQRLGVNPFKLGLTAATDTHNATPGAVSEIDWQGHAGKGDRDLAQRLNGPTLPPGTWRYSPGGLTGVWAIENGRDAIFMAMRRRETWGTSGPRIVPRFFGSFDFENDDPCGDANLVQHGYDRGVPMGRDLRPGDGEAPTFVLSALADPGSPDRAAVPLERLQIIKGSVDASGTPQVQVFDVAVDGGTYSLDTNTCAASGTGAKSLCAHFEDPDFDAERPAFYYGRIVERPTCRWSAFACNSVPSGTADAACAEAPRVIRERAWTSPIWYRPPAED